MTNKRKREAQEDELMEKALSLMASLLVTTQGDADDVFGSDHYSMEWNGSEQTAIDHYYTESIIRN